jgi:polar amino acid transport system substrate-binding protein
MRRPSLFAILSVILILTLLSLGGASACAPAPIQRSVAAPPAAQPVETPGAALRYAVFPAPPYMIGAGDDNAALSGVDVEIVQALAARLGVPVEPIRCTWTRCLELMQAGEADLLSSVYKKPDREAYLHYLDDPYLDQLPIAFYYLKGKPYRIEKYEDIYTLPSIGVLRDGSYFERFDQDAAVNKVAVSSQDQLFPMLRLGRVEAIAGYVPTENYRIAVEHVGDKIERSAYVYNETAYVYLALSQKSLFMARLDEINRINRQLLDEKVIAQIIADYYDRYH